MKNLKKLTALTVGTAMVFSVAATAFAAEEPAAVVQPIAAEEQVQQRYIFGTYGTIAELDLENNLMTVETENNESFDSIRFVIAPETILVDNDQAIATGANELKEGDRIYVYYGQVMTMSLPPQTVATVILTNVDSKAPAKLVDVAEVNKNEDGSVRILNQEGDYYITLLPENPITPYRTRQMVTVDSVEKGSRLLTWFEIAALSMPAQATADRAMLLPDAQVEAPEETPADAVVEVAIDGTVVDLKGAELVERDGVTMIPLRAVAETLGFGVGWDPVDEVATVDNGRIKTRVALGEDAYTITMGKSISTEPPVSYGAPAELINDLTYVPAQLFNALLQSEQAVTVDGATLNIVTQ